MSKIWPVVAVLLATGLACGTPAQIPAPIPTPHITPLPQGTTAYGFFPSPPEITYESILTHYADMATHADVVLMQQNVPWTSFPLEGEAEPQSLIDIRNQVTLAHQNGLEPLFVVDPLNGLNRSEFIGLPFGWKASFSNPKVRQGYTDFALWILHAFHPRYLGLASEINTYADAHPEDFPEFLSLYREVYSAIKQDSPETRVFVTFQWEDLNNLFPGDNDGRRPYQISWETVEAFEPQLDVWAISSYPFVAFASGADIPRDYYTPLLTRTDRPLAVAEGGYTSRPIGLASGTEQDQVDYLTALHEQIGSRLDFWIYLLLTDLDVDSYGELMRKNGVPAHDVETLGYFAFVGLQAQDGSAKPGLEVWDSFRFRRPLPDLRPSCCQAAPADPAGILERYCDH
jgi:hypothetical protein